MPDKKLTDNDIKKALECCQKVLPNCRECPVEEEKRIMCCDLIKGMAVDYINRLEAENEVIKSQEQIKAKAYKEFADKVKKLPYYPSYTNLHKAVDNLLKELVGDK